MVFMLHPLSYGFPIPILNVEYAVSLLIPSNSPANPYCSPTIDFPSAR